MATSEHMEILQKGVNAWNQWRAEHPGIRPLFREADLSGENLTNVNLSKANLIEADLQGTNLFKANLCEANLTEADLRNADLGGANLRRANLHEARLGSSHLPPASFGMVTLGTAQFGSTHLHGTSSGNADLHGADLSEAHLTGARLGGVDLSEAKLVRALLIGADLRGTNLIEADLSEANLMNATLVGTNLERANLTGCSIYGISAWEVKLEGAVQSDLIITPYNEPTITVDNLEVAQFIYLLLNNEKIRHVIDTITSKVVLILGRFTPERKAILDAIKDKLRHHDFLPVLFDFQKPESRDFTETVSTLAHMARFVVADMTEPRIVLEEVPHIVRNIAVPLVPLLVEGEEEPVTLYNLRRNHRSILPTCRYADQDDLLASLEEKVIAPAQAKAKDLMEMR